MASNAQTKSETQPRNGIIRKILNLLSITIPERKVKRKKHIEPVHVKAKVKHHAKAPAQSHSKIQAKSHPKHKPHSSHKKAPIKPDHSLQNPKDVIPETANDPAHSPGHRRLHIDKELH